MRRVLVLWKQLAGYSAACFRALQDAGAEVRVVHRAATADAPYDDLVLGRGLDAWAWSSRPTVQSVRDELDEVRPDIVLSSSWEVTPYRRALRGWGGRTSRVLCMDNPWRGTPKQWGGRLIAPAYVQPAFDLAFVPGERQATFARMLGFSDSAIRWGLYSCADDYFVNPADVALGDGFLFVGRLVDSKGVAELAEAYAQYRRAVAEPWRLVIAGTGGLAANLKGLPGVELRGFVPPHGLPALMRSAGCLVLPSRFEPWGVVVHEATASGLPVICTDACGASTRFVFDGFNGWVTPPRDPAALCEAMVRVSSACRDERQRLGRASRALADQITPSRWARYVLDRM